jgi:hypothetical protein
LFYDLQSFLVIQVVVFQPVLFFLAGFPTVPLGFDVRVALQDGFFFVSMFFSLLYRILREMDILIAMRLSPAACSVSTSSPGCHPWQAWTETWPIIWPMWIGETHLPVAVYAWMEGAIAPCTAASTLPCCVPRQTPAACAATLAALTTLLECHTSSTRTGWTAMSWQRSHALLAFLDGVERHLLNCHEMHQALQRVGIVRDVEARVVEVDLPAGQHHLEELNLERSFVVQEHVVCSWKLGHKLVQIA